MGKLFYPSNDGRLDAVWNSVVLNPLICIRLSHRHERYPIPSMGFQHVTHVVRCQVSSAEHD